MELVLKKEKVYSNNDFNRSYSCAFSNLKELKDLMIELEKTYGTIEDIICFKKDKEEDNSIIYLYEFDDMNLLKNKKGIKYGDLGIIKFECKDRHIYFLIDCHEKELTITGREATYGEKKYDPDKIGYYRDSFNNVYKYDGNNEKLYIFNPKLNDWEIRRDLLDDFYDVDSDYIPIAPDEPAKSNKR